MTKSSTKIWLKKTLQIAIITFAIFSNVGLVLATDATDSAAGVAAQAAQQKLDDAAKANGARGFSSFSLQYLKSGDQTQSYLATNKSSGQSNTNPLAAFIIQMINLITITTGSVSFLGIVVGGFLILSSAGNENQVNKGKDIIQHAIIGLVISLSAYFIVAFVQSLVFETAK